MIKTEQLSHQSLVSLCKFASLAVPDLEIAVVDTGILADKDFRQQWGIYPVPTFEKKGFWTPMWTARTSRKGKYLPFVFVELALCATHADYSLQEAKADLLHELGHIASGVKPSDIESEFFAHSWAIQKAAELNDRVSQTFLLNDIQKWAFKKDRRTMHHQAAMLFRHRRPEIWTQVTLDH